jgi:hypothetical protein
MLETIFEKLNNADKYFTEKYDITIEKIWGIDLIRVKRKSPQMDTSYTYSTDIHVNYNNSIKNMCFDIYVEKNYFFITEVRVIACNFNTDAECKIGFGIFGKKQHVQPITFYDVDITAIMKYIADMEYEINCDISKKNVILASNEYRCKDCQCKMVNVSF